MITAKIFGIGLSKTGTVSLTEALKILGITAKHFPLHYEDFLNYQALTDTSVAIGFRSLDLFFPGSKFIYTFRTEKEWLVSAARHMGVKQRREIQRYRKIAWGRENFDEAIYLDAYRRHDRDVREHFYGRTDCLIWNLCANPSWAPLCEFLGCPVPAVPFPLKNRSRVRTSPNLEPPRKQLSAAPLSLGGGNLAQTEDGAA